jgi:hypothetical protein
MEDLIKELSSRYAGAPFEDAFSAIFDAVYDYDEANGNQGWDVEDFEEGTDVANYPLRVITWVNPRKQTVTRVTIG